MTATYKNIISFAVGIALTFALMPVLKFMSAIAFGFEIHSAASFPYFHNAKVRTRPGIGDQTLFLEVDGTDVWQSGDMPGGDLGEELSWDIKGEVVTLKLQGQPFIRYDTESEKLVEIEKKEPIKLR